MGRAKTGAAGLLQESVDACNPEEEELPTDGRWRCKKSVRIAKLPSLIWRIWPSKIRNNIRSFMIISLFFYYTGLNVTSCCSWLISFLRVSYTLSCGGADVRMGPAQLAFLLHRMYGNFLFYIGCFLQWKPIFFFISCVSCFHVFPCVHFQYTLPAPARLCVAWSNERA